MGARSDRRVDSFAAGCVAFAVSCVMLLAPFGCSDDTGNTGNTGNAGNTGNGGRAGPSAPPPSANPQQYTLTMDSFEVPPGAEFYKCQDMPNPFGKDIAILQTESNVSLGAHHMFAFRISAGEAVFARDGSKGPIVDCPSGGLEFHPYFHLTQRAHDVTTYPAGVGRSLKAADVIRFNVHYLNTTGATIQVGAQVTVSYVSASAVSQLAAEIFVFSASLQVPVGMSTQTLAYQVPMDLKFLQVTGHMHRRGTHYEASAIAAATGATRPLYSSDNWDEPVSLDLTPGFEMKSGDTLQYACTYNNDTGATLTYGESAATNEMCNFFGVFYPSVNGSGLFMGL